MYTGTGLGFWKRDVIRPDWSLQTIFNWSCHICIGTQLVLTSKSFLICVDENTNPNLFLYYMHINYYIGFLDTRMWWPYRLYIRFFGANFGLWKDQYLFRVRFVVALPVAISIRMSFSVGPHRKWGCNLKPDWSLQKMWSVTGLEDPVYTLTF